nr:precorrin-8X methylmutase [Chroococcidiopsis cubana]
MQEFAVPQIWTEGSKGGATVATAILDGLLELAWLAYAPSTTVVDS